MRVQIPAYTDHWMKGDRFGEVIKVIKTPRPGRNRAKWREGNPLREIATVVLDISGKTTRVLLDDCKVL